MSEVEEDVGSVVKKLKEWEAILDKDELIKTHFFNRIDERDEQIVIIPKVDSYFTFDCLRQNTVLTI
jgi:hypothetical protein